MIIRVELTDWEIKQALAKAIKEKISDADFYADKIKVQGSVKFKNKYRRKNIVRFKASVEYTK